MRGLRVDRQSAGTGKYVLRLQSVDPADRVAEVSGVRIARVQGHVRQVGVTVDVVQG